MEIDKLIEHKQKDNIGKYYFSKAVGFTVNKEFGKAYEFFLQGLDILTCDCQNGWVIPNSEKNKIIFEDINVKHLPHYEYYFVKAYILSYEKDKKNQYKALDAIEKYLEAKDDEYGNYVKGKILLALNHNEQAYDSFESASFHGVNKRHLYRLGRTKEQFLEQRGLEQLYYSFVQNPTSACCARVLKKYFKEQGIELLLNDNETNPLLIEFNRDEDEWTFQKLYEIFLKKQLDNNESIAIENTEIINSFIQGIKNNYELFIDEEEDYDIQGSEEYYEDYYKHESYGEYAGSYAQDVEGLSDDFIDDVLDGDPDAYWNID